MKGEIKKLELELAKVREQADDVSQKLEALQRYINEFKSKESKLC